MVVAKIADRSTNILLEDLGVQVPLLLARMVFSIEEVLELCLPALACLGWAQTCFPAAKRSDQSDRPVRDAPTWVDMGK
jgi:hypothetical protein